MSKKKIKKLESQVEKLQLQMQEMAAVIDVIAETQKKTSVKVLEALENQAKSKPASKVKTEEAPKKGRAGKTEEEKVAKAASSTRRGRAKRKGAAEAAKEAPKPRQKRNRKADANVKPEMPVEEAAEAAGQESVPEAKPDTTSEPDVKWEKEDAPASEAEPKEKKTRAPRTDSVVLYNCDEAKSPESLFNRGDEVFRDSTVGRRALLNKLRTEIAEGRIALLNNYPPKIMQIEILDGNYAQVNKHLQYGLIEKIPKTAE